MLLFFAGSVGKKAMRCQSLWGGGGGGGGLCLTLITFTIFFLQHNDNIILFVVSIGFLCVRRYGLTRLSARFYIIICTDIS